MKKRLAASTTATAPPARVEPQVKIPGPAVPVSLRTRYEKLLMANQERSDDVIRYLIESYCDVGEALQDASLPSDASDLTSNSGD